MFVELKVVCSTDEMAVPAAVKILVFARVEIVVSSAVEILVFVRVEIVVSAGVEVVVGPGIIISRNASGNLEPREHQSSKSKPGVKNRNN